MPDDSTNVLDLNWAIFTPVAVPGPIAGAGLPELLMSSAFLA